MPEALRGRVVAVQANFCEVVPDPGDTLSGEPRLSEAVLGERLPSNPVLLPPRLLCTRRSRLNKSGQQVCVGDRVRLEALDPTTARATVVAVEPRRNLLSRPAVANVSRVVVVVALEQPALDPLQLTRFLISAESTGAAVQLVFSKADCVAPALVAAWLQRVQAWGYQALAVSVQRGEGLQALRQALDQPGIAVLCGPSGVGKSSLLNALIPALALRVAAVSGRLQRGRHTTRHVELFPFGRGALLADSPGFNRPLPLSDPGALVQGFPELRRALAAGGCRFSNCRHLADPGCALAESWDRQELYRQCLLEVETLAARPPETGREAGLRQRGHRLEPRLDPNLRRSSRRRDRQGQGQTDPWEDT